MKVLTIRGIENVCTMKSTMKKNKYKQNQQNQIRRIQETNENDEICFNLV